MKFIVNKLIVLTGFINKFKELKLS